jgi:hypothetical protein
MLANCGDLPPSIDHDDVPGVDYDAHAWLSFHLDRPSIRVAYFPKMAEALTVVLDVVAMRDGQTKHDACESR